ncbi:hypothetical protein L208DRAFT_1241224, partial [Tricholoma matsutake]
NHWVTVILDVKTLSILYGDLYKLLPPIELCNTLQWWLLHHQAEVFEWSDLPSSSQSDHLSCPIFSANTMAHGLLLTTLTLMAKDCSILACMDMLIWIITYFRQASLVSDGLQHENADLQGTTPLGHPWHIQCSATPAFKFQMTVPQQTQFLLYSIPQSIQNHHPCQPYKLQLAQTVMYESESSDTDHNATPKKKHKFEEHHLP